MRADFSSMPGSLIADEMAKWTAEASRLLELHGVLQAAKIRQDITVKHAQNVARSRVREEARKEIEDADSSRTKMPTATEINDLIEADQTLREARTDMGEVEALLAGVKAVLEATNLILNALSREITRRGDQSRGAV